MAHQLHMQQCTMQLPRIITTLIYIIHIQGATYKQQGPLIPTQDLTIQFIEFTFTHD